MSHYCDFTKVKETMEGIHEVCRECKRTLITRKKEGRNEPNYLKEHIRDTAQPNGRTGKIFSQYYGKVVGKGKFTKVSK